MRRTISRLARFIPPNTQGQTLFPPVDVSNFLPSNNGTQIDAKPGQYVASMCQQHRISFPQHQRPIRPFKPKDNPFGFSVLVSQKHCLPINTMKYFDKFEHPFTKSVLDIYIEKKKEPLWMSCFMIGATPFPRSKATKKVVHALRDALAAAGYDRFGRRVLVDGERSVIADLHGSLRITSDKPQALCNAKFLDLLEYAKQIISAIEVKLARDENGRYLATERQQQQRPLHTHSARPVPRREHDNQHGQRLSFRPRQESRPRY
ncbi:hypothetical protein GGS24DRAFT_445442 [Hypoxylon argillaceum]|nr:hypothetical protein GGS24DRAFT_445442 [Hypoxylon argillaceum]